MILQTSSSPQMDITFQNDDHILGIVVRVLSELMTRRVNGVIQGDVLSTNIRIQHTPVLSLPHGERGAGFQIQDLHSTILYAVSPGSERHRSFVDPGYKINYLRRKTAP